MESEEQTIRSNTCKTAAGQFLLCAVILLERQSPANNLVFGHESLSAFIFLNTNQEARSKPRRPSVEEAVQSDSEQTLAALHTESAD